ncbi:MAG: YhgN family NAAT transporter [Chlorobiota bacterium]
MDGLSASIWSSAVVLFFLMDPLGNVPVVLSVLKDIDPKRQRVIIARELLIALVILLIFLFLGKPMLNFLHLQQEAVTISGGIILLIIGLRMIFPSPEGIVGQQPDGEPFIVPLAIPLIAGPSVLAMLILMTQSGPNKMTDWLFALLIAWVLTAIILLSAPLLLKLLRRRGLTALERLMGMILVMISVQMLINGLKLLY